MKIEITKDEVTEIILAHVNSLIANRNEAFNTVSFGSYYSNFNEVTVSYVAPEVTNDQA